MFDGPWESCMLVRGLTPSDCASWVQAWGAVIAILASTAIAILIQRHAARRENAAKLADESRLLRLMGQFVFDARAKLRHVEETQLPHLHRDWAPIDAPIASIRAIPLDKHPAERAAFAIALALQSYEFMREEYAKMGNTDGTRSEVDKVGEARRYAIAVFLSAEQLIEAALADRGSELLKTQIDFPDGISIRTLEPDPITDR